MKLTTILVVLVFVLGACSTSKKMTESTAKGGAAPVAQATPVPTASDTQATPKGKETKKTVLCKNNDDIRTITNVTSSSESTLTDGKKCQIVYGKNNNNSDVVAYARHQTEFCNEVFLRIQTNLESAGFHCEVQNRK